MKRKGFGKRFGGSRIGCLVQKTPQPQPQPLWEKRRNVGSRRDIWTTGILYADPPGAVHTSWALVPPSLFNNKSG
eukprot:COSAG04_NODE_9608_length_848_cov_0.610147_1_plen_74_part_10